MKNWAANYEYRATKLHFPKTTADVQALVRDCKTNVRALGTRHSFHGIADAEGGELISLKYLDRIVRLDLSASPPTATVEAGITYGQLSTLLDRIGYALPNMASLPHISVAGACATATHGSGDGLQSLASAISALKFIDARGDVQERSRAQHGDEFDGMVVALGGLGVVVELTVDLELSFEIQQQVYENVRFDDLSPRFADITKSAYSVSLFTDWQDERFNQVWFKSRPAAAHFDLRQLNATLAPQQRHPAQGSCNAARIADFIRPEKCTQQLGVPGPWHKRLPHFRVEDEPSTGGQEVQTEYLISRDDARSAFQTLFGMADRIRPLIQIAEIRTIAADELWVSPFYKRPSVALHFTWMNDQPEALTALLPDIEAQLERFGPRPHWGKVFAMSREQLQPRYPELARFQALLKSYDEAGKFRNAFLRKYIM